MDSGFLKCWAHDTPGTRKLEAWWECCVARDRWQQDDARRLDAGLAAMDAVQAIRLDDNKKCVAERWSFKDLRTSLAVRREAAILKRISHPSICRIHETLEEDRAIYVVAEFNEGQLVFDTVMEGVRCQSFGEASCSSIVRQLFEALKHCHAHGVPHREVSPSNVIVLKPAAEGDPPLVKLVNFGWLNPLQLREGQSRACLARASVYLSPEAINSGAFTCESDVWSAGAILLVILCGCLPCPETLRQQLEAVASKATRDLFLGILEMNPNKRISAAKALEYPWLAANCTETQTAEQIGNFREILKPFVDFYTIDKLQAAALINMDCQVACRQIEALRGQFEPIGAIPKDELLRAMRLAPVACVPDACNWVHQIWEEEQGGNSIAEMQPATLEAVALKFMSSLSNEATQTAFVVIHDDASGTVSSERVSALLQISHSELRTCVALGGGVCTDGALDYDGFRAAIAGYAARVGLQTVPSRSHAQVDSSSSSSDTYNVCSQQMPSEADAHHSESTEGMLDAAAVGTARSLINGQLWPKPPIVVHGMEQRRRCVTFHEPAEMVLVSTPEETHFVQKFVARCVGRAVVG